ncbi:type II toxin-antitoxin system PemK/MazF family toxin [Actinoplanes sp. NPDC051851]|uniref:type II toxin-antitoxin system PemK/MazF family toxin n=1 Tax=Actinoplanes sp. NPDC051851 TaxID=3154753 RepID=UPI0034397D00
MSDATPVRGGVYTYQGIRRSEFLVISVNSLNAAGTVIVLEITEDPPGDVRGLLAVQLGNSDPLPGRWVLCWRVNYAAATRFDVAGCHGVASSETMTRVLGALRSAIEPL